MTAHSPLVRPLTVADLTDIVELQDAVTADLPVGFIRAKTEDELRAYLNGTRGVAYGIIENSHLSSVSLLRILDKKHPNQGTPFPLVPAEDGPLKACFLENTIVRPAARGRGHQRTLLDVRIAHAASAKMRWIWSGVHLQNSVSWANLLAKGMVIAGIPFDYGYPVIGLLRALGAPRLVSDSSDRMSVPANDPSRHNAVLQAGYIGVRLAPGGEVIY
jgi:hypothetical protein